MCQINWVAVRSMVGGLLGRTYLAVDQVGLNADARHQLPREGMFDQEFRLLAFLD